MCVAPRGDSFKLFNLQLYDQRRKSHHAVTVVASYADERFETMRFKITTLKVEKESEKEIESMSHYQIRNDTEASNDGGSSDGSDAATEVRLWSVYMCVCVCVP